MTDVVAFARRDRILLAAVAAGEPGVVRPSRVDLVAEDGARFALPKDQILARFEHLGAPTAGETLPAWLAGLRAKHAREVQWHLVHDEVAAGTESSLEDLALVVAVFGAQDAEEPMLTTVLATSQAEPWFRRQGLTYIAATRESALSRLAATAAKALAESEDAAFRAWFAARDRALPPEGIAGALKAVSDFALAGDIEANERGRKLLAPFDLAEPDLALEALVAAGVLGSDVNPTPHRCGLGHPMPHAARGEAHRVAELPPGHAASRLDLTGLYTVSVDGDDTTEVDDAISVRRLPSGEVELLVHISDVADAIEKGSALDRAALARMSSLYMPDGAVTMLPADLIEKRLSLDLGRPRAAVTGIFAVDGTGAVTARAFHRSMICVTRRLNYTQTEDPAVLAETPELAQALVDAATALRGARVRAGAVVVSMPSLDVTARDGVPVVALRHQDSAGDLVVAEAAVLYNSEAGRLLAAADMAAFFRAQGPPKPAPADDDPLRDILMRRRFAPTHLRVEPERHHGVGADAYAQSTSPMRRYADLVNQRQLLALLDGAPTAAYAHGDLEKLAEQVSLRERAIRHASDDRTQHFIARLLLGRRGETLPGILSRVPRRGLGSVFSSEFLREFPLRPSDDWTSPPEGTPGTWTIARVLPWRGRVELEPAPPPNAG